MEKLSYLVRFEYEYFETQSPKIYILTRKKERDSWEKRIKPMDPDPNNKGWYLFYLTFDEPKFQYTFLIKSGHESHFDTIHHRNADLDKIPEENIIDGIRNIKDSWGTFYINFDIQCSDRSLERLQISTCTRVVGDEGPPKYDRFWTMKEADNSKIEHRHGSSLKKFHRGKIYSYSSTHKIDNYLKKVYFKLRFNKFGSKSKGYDVTFYDPNLKKIREVGILKLDDIEDSLFCNMTARGIIDEDLTYTPFEIEEELPSKENNLRGDTYERKYKDNYSDRNYRPSQRRELKEKKYYPREERKYFEEDEVHPSDRYNKRKYSYTDERYAPGRERGYEDGKPRENKKERGKSPISNNLIQLSDNLFCAPFPKTEREFEGLQDHHIKGALCVSNLKGRSNFDQDEYLPNENVQQVLIMNSGSKVLSKISIYEIPESSHEKYNFRLTMATNELKYLIFQDKLKACILYDENDKDVADGLVSFILSNPIEG
ncbi:unnamed protein product [Moneuplotes crassus]|uniref:Uncharacterized protein n=1 Tax=Euplotes crassus TaxID=5936 RepID=A0AAD1XDI5_EUPCR|nr:unnamed protein product [Moneuplotes crassus]